MSKNTQSDYIESQSENIKMLYIIGATKQNLYKIYMRMSSVLTVISLIPSFVIGISLMYLFLQNTGYYMRIGFAILIIQFFIIAITIMAYNLPTHIALKNKLKTL